MRYIFLSLAMAFLFSAACAGAENIELQPLAQAHKTSPGTFLTQDVKSPEVCKTLCEGQKFCRGFEVLQPDTRVDAYTCYLNNGQAEGSPFEIKAPTPIDMKLALKELNAYRARFGLQALTYNEKLTAASLRHVRDLAKHDTIAHEGSDGSNHAERAEAAGYDYRFIAENVATGQKSWAQVFKGWQNSPGHNKNLLHKDVSEFGMALVFDLETEHLTYWAMLVGSPRS